MQEWGVRSGAFPGFGMGWILWALSHDLRKLIYSEKLIVIYPSSNYSFLIRESHSGGKTLSAVIHSFHGDKVHYWMEHNELHHFTLQMGAIWDIKEWAFSKDYFCFRSIAGLTLRLFFFSEVPPVLMSRARGSQKWNQDRKHVVKPPVSNPTEDPSGVGLWGWPLYRVWEQGLGTGSVLKWGSSDRRCACAHVPHGDQAEPKPSMGRGEESSVRRGLSLRGGMSAGMWNQTAEWSETRWQIDVEQPPGSTKENMEMSK